jgi:hypothetical protein
MTQVLLHGSKSSLSVEGILHLRAIFLTNFLKNQDQKFIFWIQIEKFFLSHA